MEKYRDWNILESLPDGWVIDNTAGSPAPNTVFITNGKSVLNGQKRALLKVNAKRDVYISKNEIKQVVEKQKATENIVEKQKATENIPFPAKTVNTLARKKFQEQLLKEIHFDLMVCEIEGWNKTEYIKELQKLLNSIDVSKKKKKGNDLKQQSLFDALT